MEKILNRSEINNEYKWDLSKIYKDNNELENDILKIKEYIKKFNEYEKKYLEFNDSNILYKITKDIFDSSRIISKIYTYASLKNSEDISSTKSLELLDRVETIDLELNKATNFYSNRLLTIDYSDIEKMYKENSKLKEYKRYFEKSFRYKKYMLSEQEEKLMVSLSKAFNDSETIFDTLADSDIDFGRIKDEENNEVELTSTNYRKFVESKERRVRHDAFMKLYNTYARYKTTFTHLLTSHVKSNAAYTKVRGYNSFLECSMYQDEMNPKVFDILVKSVREGLSPLYKYYKIKKEILGLNELHLYDTFAPVVTKYDKKYTYEEAKKIIMDVTSILGDDYVKNIERAFNEKWIDVYPNKGKRGGAFSGGCYDTYPYILTNFQNGYDDVSTLIHELGHSMHSYYSRENNPYEYSSYSIVVAEVASTVNELLLAKYMLKNSKDIEEKLYILDSLMTLFKGTIYRQTMFEEFEKYLYDNIEKDIPLSSDKLCEKFYKLNKIYFGDDIVVDDEIKYEWERMPHLYYDFYMYKYATGLSSACYIVNSILEGKENAKENYIKFLKSGSTLPPCDELKIAGVDLENKNTYKEAIKMFTEIVDEFEEVYKEYKKK